MSAVTSEEKAREIARNIARGVSAAQNRTALEATLGKLFVTAGELQTIAESVIAKALADRPVEDGDRLRADVNYDNARILSESLVRSVDDLTSAEAERDSLRAQCDALREALEKIKASWPAFRSAEVMIKYCVAVADAALAMTEGGK